MNSGTHKMTMNSAMIAGDPTNNHTQNTSNYMEDKSL